MHTLKTVPISLCKQTYFETAIFYRRSTDLFMLFSMVISDLFNYDYMNMLMIMTEAHNILSKVDNMSSIEQFLAHSLIMVLNIS